MFDAIAPRYDLLNHVLSAGMDRRWRDRAIEALALPPGARVLDLCTGTADLAIAATHLVAPVSVVGIDFSREMLKLAQSKLSDRNLGRSVRLIRGDATRIPLGNASCDAATMGFGIRNVAYPDRALAELARVLRPGGRLAILEFGQPRVPGVRTLYCVVFPLPAAARRPHRLETPERLLGYLPASVGHFPPPAEFARTIAATGFSQVRAVPLTFGIVYLYVAERS